MSAQSIGARLNARLGLGRRAPKVAQAQESLTAQGRGAVVASRRKTSNSRGPGQEGTVYVHGAGLHRCRDCGSLMSNLVPRGRHSVRFVECDGRHVLADCMGREVR